MTSKPSHLKETSETPVKFTDEVGVEASKEVVEKAINEARDEVLEADKEDEVPAAVTEETVVKKDKIPPISELKSANKRPLAEVTKENRILVKQLRQNDSVDNQTCAYCLKRKHVQEFARLKQSDVCMECED